MMNFSEILSQVLLIVGILVIFVNVVTEVAKKVWPWLNENSVRVNVFVTVFSVIFTVAALLAYYQIKQMVITWYIILAFIIVGFMVAYAAMFGYDKLIKLFKKE